MNRYFQIMPGLAFVACIQGASAAGIATTASVFIRADADSYVGYRLPAAGETFLHGVDSVFRTINTGDQAAYIYASADEDWTFEFSAAKYSAAENAVSARELIVGFYGNATRYPFNSLIRPGMNVSGGSRGYSQLSGWFNVLEVSYDEYHEVTKLAVDFGEYGENLTQSGPGLYGSLRYNSAIPLNLSVPEPHVWGQLLLGLLALGGFSRFARRSVPPLKYISKAGSEQLAG